MKNVQKIVEIIKMHEFPQISFEKSQKQHRLTSFILPTSIGLLFGALDFGAVIGAETIELLVEKLQNLIKKL